MGRKTGFHMLVFMRVWGGGVTCHGPVHGVDRGVDRGLDRGVDRGVDRGLERVSPAMAPCTAFCASSMQYRASDALAGTERIM